MNAIATRLRCAVYARKSTDDQQTEPNRSVARQVAHAKQYAQRKGWRVIDEHVYADDGSPAASSRIVLVFSAS